MGQNEMKMKEQTPNHLKKEYEKKLNRNCFEFQYIIGRGGFGKVWKVQLKKTKEIYALKEMSKVKIIDRRSEESIISERKLLSKLNNPFIVNMYFAFQDFSNLYLVMDYLTGGDLRYHIAKNHFFSENQTKFFISNIILGLQYIHSNNIIHRDIKPENLVCDSRGYIRITDFGIAKINEEDNSSETSGTPGYMSPEVLFIQNHSFPSDFFALGIITYEFCLGYRPYLGRNRKEIKDVILHKQAKINLFDLPSDWSEDSANFINALLIRKPEKRLGFKGGVKDLMEHPWMKDVNWDLMKKKKIKAPFIPNIGEENFDKSYCEMIERIGNETMERYRDYMNDNNFIDVFQGYFYFNYVPQNNNFFGKVVSKKIVKRATKNNNVYENKFRNVLSASELNVNKSKDIELRSERNKYDNEKKNYGKYNSKLLNKSNSVHIMCFRNKDKSKNKDKGNKRYNRNSVSYNNILKGNTNNDYDVKYRKNSRNSKSKNKNNIKRNLNSSSISRRKDYFLNIMNKKEKMKEKIPINTKSQNNIKSKENQSDIQEMLENDSFHFIDNLELNDNLNENIVKNNNIKDNFHYSSNTNRSHLKQISLDIPESKRLSQRNYNNHHINYPIFKSKIMSWLNKSNFVNKSKSKDKISLSTTNLLSNENKENIRNNNNSRQKQLIYSNNTKSQYIRPLSNGKNKKNFISNNSSKVSKNSIKNTDNGLNKNKLQRNYSTYFSPLQKNKIKNKNKKILIPKSYNINHYTNNNIINNTNNGDNHQFKINTFIEIKKIYSNGKTNF